MADEIKNTEQAESIVWIIEFIKKYRLVLAIGISVIFALFVGYSFYTQIRMNQYEKSAEVYDTAIGIIDNLQSITNTKLRGQYYAKQIQNLQMMVQNYPKTVPAIRARLFLGRVFYMDGMQNKDSLKKALGYYQDAVNFAPNPFYKSLSLIGLGLCYEQQNEFKKAFDADQEIIQKYSDTGFEATALIGMARSREMMNQVKEALVLYQQLVRDYPNSVWASFARGKLYYYSDPNSPARAQKESVSQGSSTSTNGPSVQLLGQ